jgi:endonuclease-3
MQKVLKIINILEKSTKRFTSPLINQLIDEFGKDPFIILIGCLLSLRAKDVMTVHVCRDLFKRAKTPQEILLIKRPELEKIIFKAGFYKNKAKVLHDVSRTILDKFSGKVPNSYEKLISIKGVGPKTANLVLGMAFDIPAICVDIHVHRISNRLGVVKTTTAEQTLKALEKAIPKNKWIIWNKLLVMWGQNICLPRGPRCGICAINKLCDKVGVKARS